MPNQPLTRPLAATTILLAAYLSVTLGLVGDVGSPSLVAPVAIPAAIPYLLLTSRTTPFLVLASPLLLFLIYVGLFHRTGGPFPAGHIWAGRAIMVLSAVWFWNGWGYGVQIEGSVYVITCACLSLVFFAALEIQGRQQVRRPTTSGRLLYSWLFFAWIFSYAFPWMGEVM